MLRIFASRPPLIAIALLSLCLPPAVGLAQGRSQATRSAFALSSAISHDSEALLSQTAPSPNGEDAGEEDAGERASTGQITIAASPTMTVVSRTLEQQLEASADSDIQVQSVDASAALELMDSGQVDFAAISRPLTDAERAQGWQEETLTREKIAVVIGADNPFQGELTFDQFVDIFRGDLANWSAVGGPDVPIRFLDRPADSDSRVSLSQYEIFKTAPFETGDNTTVLSADDTAELATQLEADGIGYAIASQVLNQSDLRVVPMDGVLPDSDLYPYSQPRNLVYKGTLSPAAQAFLEFALSESGQQAIAQAKSIESAEVAIAEIPRGKVVVSPDGERLVSANADGTLQFWDAEGNPDGDPIEAHSAAITDIVYDADGQTLTTASADGTVRRWDAQGNPVQPTLTTAGPVTAVATNFGEPPNGSDADREDATADGGEPDASSESGADDSASAEGESPAPEEVDEPAELAESAEPTDQSGDGPADAQPLPDQGAQPQSNGEQTLATAGADGTLQFWDGSGNPKGEPVSAHGGTVAAIAFSPDGQTVISGGEDGNVRFWTADGTPQDEPYSVHTGPVTALAISPDGQQVASGGADGQLRLWNQADGDFEEAIAAHPEGISAVAFHPADGTIATAGDDGIRLWQANGEAIATPITDLANPPSSLTFSPDGERIIAGDISGTPQQWDRQGNPITPTTDSENPPVEPPAEAEVDAEATDSIDWLAMWQSLPLWLRWGLLPVLGLVLIVGAALWGGDRRPSENEVGDDTKFEGIDNFDDGDNGTADTPADPPDLPPAPRLNSLGVRLSDAKAALAESVELAKAGDLEAALGQAHRAIEAADVERLKALAAGASASGVITMLMQGLTQRSRILERLGRHEDAINNLDTALGFDPEDQDAIALKDQLLAGAGAVGAASVLFERAEHLIQTDDSNAAPDKTAKQDESANDTLSQERPLDADGHLDKELTGQGGVDNPDSDRADHPDGTANGLTDIQPSDEGFDDLNFSDAGDLDAGDLDSLGNDADVPPDLLVAIAELPDAAQTLPWITMTPESTEVLAKATATGDAVNSPEQANDLPADVAAAFAALPTDAAESETASHTAPDIPSNPLAPSAEAESLGAVRQVDIPDQSDQSNQDITTAPASLLDWPDGTPSDDVSDEGTDPSASEQVPADLQAMLKTIPADTQTLPWVDMTPQTQPLSAAGATVAERSLDEKNRVTLAPCNTRWAYVSWQLTEKSRTQLQQPDAQLALRLYSVSTGDKEDKAADTERHFQQHECYDLAREWYLPIPNLNQDYRVEVGYFNADKRWQPLAQSPAVYFPDLA